MSAPRQVLQGTTYLITRRCADRRFLLTPDTIVRTVFLYCLAMAAQLAGMQVHAMCVMSNHYHLVVTDVLGAMPQFIQWLNRHTANCLKRHRSWRGCFWEPGEKCSAVALTTPGAVLEKLVYVITNPVSAGLVRRASHWPGLVTLPQDWRGKTINTRRPKLYFRHTEDSAPRLELTIPPQFADWGSEQFIDHVRQRVSERERAIEKEMLKCRRTFLGAANVRTQDPLRRAKSQERRGTRNPEFAAITKAGTREAGKNLRGFKKSYREAMNRFRAGERDVPFPAGTWWMVRYVGVRCLDSC